MRIIDKNTDFYDYLQDSTDTIVFDRRNSFLLTKEKICNGLNFDDYFKNVSRKFILLQCGCTYWLFLATITNRDEHKFVSDYTLELLTNWKNYNKPRRLISVGIVSVSTIYLFDYHIKDFNYDRIIARVNDIKDMIDQNAYNFYNLCRNTVTKWKKNEMETIEQTIPILKACGVSQFINPIDIFTAIEEYFSMEKTASERTEPIGATNNDKITRHGFDTKTSFRGKV